MDNINRTINKLVLGLNAKGRIVLVNNNRFYSKQFKKICNKFVITDVSEEKQELRSKLKELRKLLKTDKSKELEIKQEIEDINFYLEANFINGKNEFFKRIDVLFFLKDYYKKVCDLNG